jgi:hypothetical protein
MSVEKVRRLFYLAVVAIILGCTATMVAKEEYLLVGSLLGPSIIVFVNLKRDMAPEASSGG